MSARTAHQDTATAPPSRLRGVITVLCVVMLLASVATPALARVSNMESQMPEENATSHPATDALILRPLGFLSLATGFALFLPAAAITLATRPTDI
jgi:hypothetical protein